MKIYCFFVFCIVLLFCLEAKANNQHLILQEIRKLDFDTLIPNVGSCYYDSSSNSTKKPSKNSTCSSFSGSKGLLKLIAAPNSYIELEFKSTESMGGLVVFNPEGVVKVDLDEIKIYANQPLRLKVGLTGVVDIEIGGYLIFTNTLSHGLNVSLNYDIKYKYVD